MKKLFFVRMSNALFLFLMQSYSKIHYKTRKTRFSSASCSDRTLYFGQNGAKARLLSD